MFIYYRGHSENVELLKYQLQSLRDKCCKLESLQSKYHEMLTENEVLHIIIIYRYWYFVKLLKEKLESYTGEQTELTKPLL